MKCEACGHENVDGARFCAKCGAILATPEEGPDPLVGQLIGGRYRVTGVLGEGGMGKVYVGEQQMGSTVRKVAIKTLHSHLSKDPSVLQRFHRECGTVAQLEHPNTIKFFDFGATQDGTLYIAMEFVAGKPLSDVLTQQGPLAPERVVKIMRQVCGALDEAHLQGIIHRDLKPDNIVLTDRAGETDFVKVLDFGIAARRESGDAQKEQKLTQQGMVLGTPPYMSPEQFTGKALDTRSDIYSLGVMSYEMLTGKLPFEADTPWQWATQHMSVQPTPFEVSAPARDLPAGMRQAVMKALSKDREQRQASAREFFAELSGGGRMTVTGDVPGGGGGPRHTDTAAMPQAPDFGAPAPMYAPGQGLSPHVPATAPAVVAAVPPAPPIQRSSGGGKGLIVGLGGVGALLLVAMGVIAMRSGKTSGDTTTIAIPTSTPATSDTGSFAPLPTTQPPTTATATETAPVAAAGGTPGVKPTPASTTTTPHPTTTSTGKEKPPAGGDACEQCENAARSGNLSVAASLVAKCADAEKKKACVSRAKSAAPGAAESAALNGNCSLAKTIQQIADGMGAGSKKLKDALKGSKCK
ncbi:MAG TPA: serine/threonine-protein kinase [Polyangiaceae bacterium]|jgi:serine/threonine-protein kinase|nr:serine/threonine-protein kinase [Polyangiaceae bacterium]